MPKSGTPWRREFHDDAREQRMDMNKSIEPLDERSFHRHPLIRFSDCSQSVRAVYEKTHHNRGEWMCATAGEPHAHAAVAPSLPLSDSMRRARSPSRSFTITWIVPAIGIATNAPSRPSSAAPTSTAIRTTSAGICTVRL